MSSRGNRGDRNIVEVTQRNNNIEAHSTHNVVEVYTSIGATGPAGPPGPTGPPGESNQTVAYEHDQQIASNFWQINHNLGWYPNVTVVDSAGTIYEGEIDYVNVNSLILTFSAGFSGKAYLS